MKLRKLARAPIVAAVMSLGVATVANAATYTSLLQYSEPNAGLNAAPYGRVTLIEGGSGIGAYVDVNVNLFNGSRFITSGNDSNHHPFVWNMTNPAAGVLITAPVDTFVVDQTIPDTNVPFGSFTNGILCCGGINGAANAETPPLNFHVTSASGITMLGIGGSWDGSTLIFGSGDHFGSNTDGNFAGFSGGWWFSADIVTVTGMSGNVAARELDFKSPVPEPETYTMMLTGLGLMGFIARRRRSQK